MCCVFRQLRTFFIFKLYVWATLINITVALYNIGTNRVNCMSYKQNAYFDDSFVTIFFNYATGER